MKRKILSAWKGYKILFVVVIVILSFFAGYMIGQAQAISFCVEMGIKFANRSGIDLDFDKELIKTAIMQYKEHIVKYG